MLEPCLFARLCVTLGLGVVLILIPFVKLGPDPRVAELRDRTWIALITNENGSVKAHAKLTLAAILLLMIALFWWRTSDEHCSEMNKQTTRKQSEVSPKYLAIC